MLEWYFTLLHFNLQDVQAYRLLYKFVLQLTPLQHAFQDDHDTKKHLHVMKCITVLLDTWLWTELYEDHLRLCSVVPSSVWGWCGVFYLMVDNTGSRGTGCGCLLQQQTTAAAFGACVPACSQSWSQEQKWGQISHLKPREQQFVNYSW